MRYYTAAFACLALTLTSSPALAKPRVRSYLIAIESTPPDAEIYIDGKLTGKTKFKGRVPQGTHELKLVKEGYEPFITTLIINRSSYKKTFSYTLIKAVLNPTLEVRARSGDTSADGASVSVDGADWGILPVSKQVPIGRHLVKIEKTDFLPYSEWVDLKEGEVRTISASLEPVLKAASLQVEGTPGAQVYLDGVLKGSTPALIEEIPPGRHQVKVEKDGFLGTTQWVELVGGATEVLTFTLESAPPEIVGGSLRIFTDDDPADVLLDGELKGQTPLNLDKIPPGEHFIVVRKEGFQSAEEKIQVVDRENQVLKYTLESIGLRPGSIRVISSTPDVQVYVDGNLIGPTPALVEELSSGQHFILVRKKGYRDWEKTIEVEAGQPQEFVAEMVATGSIKLLSSLPGAEIFLDGEKLEQKSLEEGEPLLFEDLPTGEHQVLLRLKGYNDAVQSVRVDAGDTALVQITLNKVRPILSTADRRKRIATYSARAVGVGDYASDIMIGIPYLLEVSAITGLVEKLDIGVTLKAAGVINELYVRSKYSLIDTPVFGIGFAGAVGVGGGPATENRGDGTKVFSFSSNNVGATGYGIASLYFKDVVTVSGRLGFHAYSDAGPAVNAFAEPDDAGNPTRDQSQRDNGFRLMIGVIAQILKSEKISYNLILEGNPGGLGSSKDINGIPRRLMYEVFPFKADPLLYLRLGATVKF